MNTDNQLAQLLKFLTETLQQGKDFTVDQAPQFVRELLAWKFYQCEVFIGVGVFIIVLGLLAAWWAGGFQACKDDADTRHFWRGGLSLLGFVIGFAMISTNIYDMVQIKVAPRVVVVEMVRNLISNSAARHW